MPRPRPTRSDPDGPQDGPRTADQGPDPDGPQDGDRAPRNDAGRDFLHRLECSYLAKLQTAFWPTPTDDND